MENEIKLRVMFTSDTHGYLLPINYADNTKSSAGLSILASAIKDIRSDNALLLDLGDTIQGSPLVYFHQLNRNKYPNPVGVMMNKMNYDYYIPGNHDFNYGNEYLNRFVKQLNCTTLCSNIYKNGDYLFKQGYDIKTYQAGFKVLIIGITTKYIPNWENPKYIKGLEFRDPYEVTKALVNQYRDQVDLVIVGYHGGLERDLHTREEFVKDTGENQGFKIFDKIKGVDILLTGHQHRTICENVNNRVVMQPGCNAALLGVVDITYTKTNGKFKKQLEPRFVKATDYAPDMELVNAIQKIEKANQKFLDEVIGFVPDNNLYIKNLVKARLNKHPIVDFINKIQLETSKAMLSSTSLANTVTGFQKEITVRNVLSTYIYANTLVVVEITGKILKEYLEKCAEYILIEDGKIIANPRFSYPKLEHYNYDMIDGIDYTFNLLKPFGQRVVSIKYKEKEINPDEIFTIVLNNYRANGGGDFYMLKDLKVVKEIPFNVAELIIDYIRRKKIIKVKGKKNIKLIT